MIFSSKNSNKKTPGKQIVLEGQIERVTFSNESTGYTVAKISSSGYRNPFTIVGNIMNPAPGEILILTGYWIDHPRFGRQFKVEDHRIKAPATLEGIKKYLGSGLIKGIGPVMAKRIVDEFGENTLSIIDDNISRLSKVEGLGSKRVQMIETAWKEQREIRDVMIFLQSHGVGSGYAAKIFKRYGRGTLSVVTKNPYRLATDISGIGFKTADTIAEKLGFDNNSPLRAEAGILYIMGQLAEDGHVYYPYDLLVAKCMDTLNIDRDIVIKGLSELTCLNNIIIEDLNQNLEKFKPDNKAVYLKYFYISEEGIANNIVRILKSPGKIRDIKTEQAIGWVQKEIEIELAAKQIEAVKKSVSDKVLVITGGPGTGKTTIIKAIIKIYKKLNAKICLAAPTGRAAKRMSEAADYPAKTIHRMLEFSINKGGFQRNHKRPLDIDILILDEVSMIDISLMNSLLKAVPEKSTVILVGDENQLPSVGAGSVLKDIISSGIITVVELNEIFRQAGKSRIIINAHKINKGNIPDLKPDTSGLEDFYFIEQENQDQVIKNIKELVSTRIPRRFKLDPLMDIQVLSPMHKGIAGTENLNRVLQKALNPSRAMLTRGDRIFRIGDKVMQVKNNYDKEVFNGDIGKITSIDPDNQQVSITFETFPVIYEYYELDEIILAYAISVHKSQGSEYPAVVIPILNQHYIMLQRNLIYTAVTRGKKLVIIVGSKKALAMGINNDRIMKRYTCLGEKLKSKYSIA